MSLVRIATWLSPFSSTDAPSSDWRAYDGGWCPASVDGRTSSPLHRGERRGAAPLRWLIEVGQTSDRRQEGGDEVLTHFRPVR